MKGFLLAAVLLAAVPVARGQQQAPADAAATTTIPSTTAPAPAVADAAMADDAQVDRLMAVMHARESLEGMWPRIEAVQRQMVQQATAGKDLDEAQRGRIDAFLAKTQAHMKEAMSWERLEPMMRDIYRKTFSRAEMESMIRFYGSAEGQQVIAKMPQLMQNSMQAMQSLIGPMMKQLQQDLEEAKAETAQ
jgi:hypothetical protein